MLELRFTRILTGVVIAGVLLALVILGGYAYRAGRLATQLSEVEGRLAASEAAFTLASHRADSLEILLPRLAVETAAATASHRRAEARSDTSEANLLHARTEGLDEAHSATATADSLRSEVILMARAESLFVERVHQERDSASARISRQADQIAALEAVVGAKDAALEAAAGMIHDQSAVIRTLQDGQPGITHRAVRGVMVSGVSVGCAGLGWLVGGPVGALVGGVGCGALTGVLLP